MRAGLHLDEVADVHVFRKVCAGAQPRIRADTAIAADARRIDMRVRLDARVRPDGDVAQHAIGADARAVVDPDGALENAADVDRHIAAAFELAADVDAMRIDDCRAGEHQRHRPAPLDDALERGELRAVVDAQHRHFVGHDVRTDRHAVGDRHRHDIGQIELFLRVVRRQASEPPLQQHAGRRDESRVDLVDGALVRRRVALLDDRPHIAVGAANHAPEAERIAHSRGQQPDPVALRDFSDARERLGCHERDVAKADERDAVGWQDIERDARGVAGAARRVLTHEIHVRRRERSFHRLGAIAGDDGDRARRERAHSRQHVRRERAAGELVQRLRQSRVHSLALTGGENDDVERGGHRDGKKPRERRR